MRLSSARPPDLGPPFNSLQFFDTLIYTVLADLEYWMDATAIERENLRLWRVSFESVD